MPLRPNLYNVLSEYIMVRKKRDTGYFIAHTMLEHLDELPTMKIEVIARKAGTTPATITKFCRTLGFRGYSDLRAPSAGTQLIAPGSLPLGSSHHETVERWVEKNTDLMKAYAKSFDTPQVRDIARRMARASLSLVITGVFGYTAVDLFMEQMLDAGISILPINRAAEIQLVQAEAQAADLVLIISLTGMWYQEHGAAAQLDPERCVLITQAPVEGVETIRLDVIPGDFFASMQVTQTSLAMFFTTLSALIYEELGQS